MSRKRDDVPGPEEQAELARDDWFEARDEVVERAAADQAGEADEYDDEETLDEILELDQTELDELGLTLDDPHQPESE